MNTFLKIIFFTTCIVFIYTYTSKQDYQDMLDSMKQPHYNCNMLIGGWHPDVPPSAINYCHKQQKGKQ